MILLRKQIFTKSGIFLVNILLWWICAFENATATLELPSFLLLKELYVEEVNTRHEVPLPAEGSLSTSSILPLTRALKRIRLPSGVKNEVTKFLPELQNSEKFAPTFYRIFGQPTFLTSLATTPHLSRYVKQLLAGKQGVYRLAQWQKGGKTTSWVGLWDCDHALVIESWPPDTRHTVAVELWASPDSSCPNHVTAKEHHQKDDLEGVFRYRHRRHRKAHKRRQHKRNTLGAVQRDNLEGKSTS